MKPSPCPCCSVAGEVLVALLRIVSNSGKFFYESCLWGGISPCASQFLLTPKASPRFTLAFRFSSLLFSGCGGKISQAVSVSGVEFGPVSGTEPSWQVRVQLSYRLDDRLLTEVKASWVFLFL